MGKYLLHLFNRFFPRHLPPLHLAVEPVLTSSVSLPYSFSYRYDGLYVVTRAWEAPSIANPKLTVCRYALQRLGGQGEIGVKQDRAQLESEAPVEVKEEESEVVASKEENAPMEKEMDEGVKEEESDPVLVAEEAVAVAGVEAVPAAEAEGAEAPPTAAPAAEEIAIVRTEEPATDVVDDEAAAPATEVAPIVVAEGVVEVVAPAEVEPATKVVETEKTSADAENTSVDPPAEDMPVVAAAEEEQEQEGASPVEVSV